MLTVSTVIVYECMAIHTFLASADLNASLCLFTAVISHECSLAQFLEGLFSVSSLSLVRSESPSLQWMWSGKSCYWNDLNVLWFASVGVIIRGKETESNQDHFHNFLGHGTKILQRSPLDNQRNTSMGSALRILKPVMGHDLEPFPSTSHTHSLLISLRSILMLFFYLLLGIPSTKGFPPKFCMYSLSLSALPNPSSQFHLLTTLLCPFKSPS